ncbi:MAG TPA: hypothetical protein VNN55_03255 [bacterium]|nr:hypothetical protein [bacterium]
MTKTRLHKGYLAAALTLLLLAAGCIVSGQFVVVISGTRTITSSDETLDYLAVDLTDNETWQDHKDDIQAIIDVKFECEFVNNLNSAADGELYISTELYTTAEQVRTNATKVFGGLALEPLEVRSVSFSESADYVENLETVLDLLEGGQFYFYGIAAEAPFDITVRGAGDEDYVRFLITFSAG